MIKYINDLNEAKKLYIDSLLNRYYINKFNYWWNRSVEKNVLTSFKFITEVNKLDSLKLKKAKKILICI